MSRKVAATHDPSRSLARFEKGDEDGGQIADIGDRDRSAAGGHGAAGDEPGHALAGLAERRARRRPDDTARVHDRYGSAGCLEPSGRDLCLRLRSAVREVDRRRRVVDGERPGVGLEEGGGARDVDDRVEPHLHRLLEHGAGAGGILLDHLGVVARVERHDGGAVDHRVGAIEGRGDGGGIRHVADDVVRNGEVESRHGVLESLGRPHQRPNLVPGLDGERRRVTTDEARGPRHHHPHGAPPLAAIVP